MQSPRPKCSKSHRKCWPKILLSLIQLHGISAAPPHNQLLNSHALPCSLAPKIHIHTAWGGTLDQNSQQLRHNDTRNSRQPAETSNILRQLSQALRALFATYQAVDPYKRWLCCKSSIFEDRPLTCKPYATLNILYFLLSLSNTAERNHTVID